MKNHISTISLLFLMFFCTGTIPAYGYSEEDIVYMLVPKRGPNISGNGKPSVTFYLQFGLNSAELTPESIDQLRLLGNGLQRGELRNYVFKIEGHTCDLGNDNENLILSRKRALSVKKYLTNTFAIPEQQLETEGFGESQPLISNTNEDSRKKNRRVVILNTLKTFKSEAEITPAVSVEIKSIKNNRIEIVHQGDTLTDKDSYSIEFKSKNYAYVYIYQTDSSGKIFDLFPSPTLSSRNNPVKPGELYRLPENIGAWIHLDNNKGKEQIIVIAHMNEIAEPEKICRQVISEPSGSDNVMLASARGPGGIADDSPDITSQAQSQPAVSPPSSIKNLFVWKQYFNHR